MKFGSVAQFVNDLIKHLFSLARRSNYFQSHSLHIDCVCVLSPTLYFFQFEAALRLGELEKTDTDLCVCLSITITRWVTILILLDSLGSNKL